MGVLAVIRESELILIHRAEVLPNLLKNNINLMLP
jgi:hypothetical protein